MVRYKGLERKSRESQGYNHILGSSIGKPSELIARGSTRESLEEAGGNHKSNLILI